VKRLKVEFVEFLPETFKEVLSDAIPDNVFTD
jgi:hypothetical protein